MTTPTVSVLVVSFDGYAQVWRPFFQCFFRHWPDCPYPVYLGSNSRTYDDARVRPILIGADRDYSTNLIRMLEQIDSEWVIVWMDDFLLVDRVDTRRIANVLGLGNREGAGFVNLISLPLELTPLFTSGDVGGELGEMRKGAPYRVVFGTALWRRSALLELLRPGETAWQIEREGSLRTNDLPWRFFFVARSRLSDPPLRVENAIEEGRWTRRAAAFLRREGMADALGTRPIQPRGRTLSVATYNLVRYLAVRTIYAIGGARAMATIARLISSRTFVMQN